MNRPDFLRRIYASAAFAAILLILGAADSRAQSAATFINADPPRDKDFPAAMEAPDIISHNTRLNAVFYLASGAGPHPVVLLLHGFPGNEQNMDLAYAASRCKSQCSSGSKMCCINLSKRSHPEPN